MCVCVRRGQNFNRWSSACEAETCGPGSSIISIHICWYLVISVDIYWIYESIRCDDNFGAEDNFLLIPYTTEVVSGAKDPRRKLRKTHHVRMLSRPLGLPSDTMLWKSKGVHGATSMPSRKLSLSAQNFAWNLASNKWPRETCGHATGRWAKLAIWLVAEPTRNKNSTQNESACYWRQSLYFVGLIMPIKVTKQ
jgi:hypothetical protein